MGFEHLNNVRHPKKEQTFDCGRVVRRGSVNRGRTGTQFESVILGLDDSSTAGESRSAYVEQLSWVTICTQTVNVPNIFCDVGTALVERGEGMKSNREAGAGTYVFGLGASGTLKPCAF